MDNPPERTPYVPRRVWAPSEQERRVGRIKLRQIREQLRKQLAGETDDEKERDYHRG